MNGQNCGKFQCGQREVIHFGLKKAGIRCFLEMNQEQSDTENNPKDLWNAGCNQEDEREEG